MQDGSHEIRLRILNRLLLKEIMALCFDSHRQILGTFNHCRQILEDEFAGQSGKPFLELFEISALAPADIDDQWISGTRYAQPFFDGEELEPVFPTSAERHGHDSVECLLVVGVSAQEVEVVGISTQCELERTIEAVAGTVPSIEMEVLGES